MEGSPRENENIISFGGVDTHDDAIIISTMIANFDVKRTPVDNGSSYDVLFYNTSRMQLSINQGKSIFPYLDFHATL